MTTAQTHFFQFNDPQNPLRLACGQQLAKFQLAFETYGELNAEKSNAILLFHAMTGSQHAAGWNLQVENLAVQWTKELHEGWWDGFIGSGKALDTDRFFVICANYLGGCYGSTGPTSFNPETGAAWGADFPPIRASDIVDSQMRLLDALGIETLHAVIGASIGGLLSLSLCTRYPDRVQNVVPIACGLETSITARILNFEQINAIESDPNFYGGRYLPGGKPDAGLALARRIAHKTFVSLEDLMARASKRGIVSSAPPFGWYEMSSPVESYMQWQGEKFTARFDANSYLRILDAWQWFDLVREARESSLETLLERCREQQFLVFSIDSDLAFTPGEQEKLVRALKQMKGARADEVTWITVHSEKGHDSFLLEPKLYAPHLRALLLGE